MFNALSAGWPVPRENFDTFSDVQNNLRQLEEFVNSFELALDLFDAVKIPPADTWVRTDANELKRMFEWRKIAARDGAMTLYHFEQTRQALPGLVAKCGFFRQHIDMAELTKAGRAFQSAFPHWGPVRHGVAHRGDSSKSRKEVSKHELVLDGSLSAGGVVLFEGDAEGVHLRGSLINRTYAATYEGKLVQYDLSAESVAQLRNVLALIAAPFEAAFRKIANPFWVESLDRDRAQQRAS